MSKRNAHIILIIADIIALLVFWWGYSQIRVVFEDIALSADAVSFTNRIGFAFVGIVMPFAQVLALSEHFWPSYIHMRRKIISRIIIVSGIALFASAILISVYMQKHVEKAGYQYCRNASGVSALSKTLVYTKNSNICQQLTAKKRAKLGLPPQ